jgi:hypothetical protein
MVIVSHGLPDNHNILVTHLEFDSSAREWSWDNSQVPQ